MTGHPDIASQRSYYDNKWSAHERATWFETIRLAKALEIILDQEYSYTPAICDLGCGPGNSTCMLGAYGDTLGVDLADVSVPAERFTHCRFESANILEWEPPKESFDVVVSLEVIEHIPYAEQRRFLEVAHRALKPGGHLILTTPNATALRSMPEGGAEWTKQPVEDWLTAGELRQLLAEQFRVERVDSFALGYGCGLGHRIAGSSKLHMIAKRLGMAATWRRFWERQFYGLHLLAHTVK